MISPSDVHQLAASQTYPLRHAILRPNQPPEACVYPGDDDADSFHLGINQHGQLIAVASFYREPLPGPFPAVEAAQTRRPSPDLRIRGMAVLPEYRGRGLGRALVNRGLRIAGEQSPPPESVWCNARTTAAGYYATLGFRPRGDEFEIEGIGPHFVMVRMIAAGSDGQ